MLAHLKIQLSVDSPGHSWPLGHNCMLICNCELWRDDLLQDNIPCRNVQCICTMETLKNIFYIVLQALEMWLRTPPCWCPRGGRRRGSLNSSNVVLDVQVLPRWSPPSCEFFQCGSSSRFQIWSCSHIGHTGKCSPLQVQFPFPQKALSQVEDHASWPETLPSSWNFFFELMESSSSLTMLSSHFPWCPRKMWRRGQHWGRSWRSVPCWPALGRKPCTGRPGQSCLHSLQEQPFSSVISELRVFFGEPRENTSCCFR